VPADEGELVLGQAVQVLLGEAALADEVGEDDGEDGVAEVELAVDLFAALGEEVFQIPQLGGCMILAARSLASRIVASSSRCRARSKALRAMVFSAGDHFRLRISV
jgi:hypothetical protein